MSEASPQAGETKAQQSILHMQFTVLDWFGVVVASLGSLFLAAFPFTVARAFAKMFRDMGGGLPAITMIAISPGPVLAVAGLCLCLVVAGIWPGRSLLRRRLLVVAAFTLFLAAIGFLASALYAPVFALADSIK